MIGVDTNVLIRLVVSDNVDQNTAAREFFGDRSPDDPAYISGIVLAETIWLLRRRFGYSRKTLNELVYKILQSDDFVVEHGERLLTLFDDASSPLPDVADQLIAWSAERAGCSRTVTFDRRAAQLISSMELLP